VADFIGSLNLIELETGRVAVRPERVRISGIDGSAHNVEGVIADVVYLGMYTQFHVDTPFGRVVSHRLADEPLGALATGSRVALSWDAEHEAPAG
jgi:ABC-type Fe3+/spermidine/putrescine transport system ATPase subunit